MYTLGIDLGTTNCVAAVYQHGKKRSLPLDGGRFYLPSVVSFRNDKPTLIGRPAKSSLPVFPENTVSSAKRFMGNRKKQYHILEKDYTPVDVSAIILRHIVEMAQKSLGEEIWDAVITVPAYFNDEQRADTKRAGEQAGLNVLLLLPEPTAAAISYGIGRSRDQTIMVYDLGGGTFDVSILQVKGHDFRVIAVGGDSRLGGDDFDEAIVGWIEKHIENETGKNILTGMGREHFVARQKLKEAAEQAKKELSDADEAEIVIPEILGTSVQLNLNLQRFNSLIQPLIDRSILRMKDVLRDAGMTADDIDRVIMVGGSTRVRAVREAITAEIREPYSDESPDEAVAWGAAIRAAYLDTPDTISGINVIEATAHTLGVGMYVDSGDDNKELELVPMIPRNTNYPCSSAILGFTIRDYQEVIAVGVFRGEERLAHNNDYLGELAMHIKRPRVQPVPVANLFQLDNNGILHFKVIDIPLDEGCHPSIIKLLSDSDNSDGALDIALLESLIQSGVLPTPEEVSIDIGNCL